MNARQQIATVVALWRKEPDNVDSLIESLAHLFHSITPTPVPHHRRTEPHEHLLDILAERKAILVRLQAIDDEIADHMRRDIELGAGVVLTQRKRRS